MSWDRYLPEPAFWAHYCGNLLPPDVRAHVFGGARSRRSLRPAKGARKVLLEVPFPGKIRWRIELRASGDIAHSLFNEDYPDQVAEVGWFGAHAAGPILRWEEVRTIALGLEAFWRRPGSPLTPGSALLLFRPMACLTTAAEAKEAESLLRSAWTATGMLEPAQVEEVVEASVYVTPVPWVQDRKAPECGFATTAAHSLRQPRSEVAFCIKTFLDEVGRSAKPIAKRAARPPSAAKRALSMRRRTWQDGLTAAEVDSVLRGLRAFRLILPDDDVPARLLPPATPFDPGFELSRVHGSFFAVADRVRAARSRRGADARKLVARILRELLPQESASVLHVTSALPKGMTHHAMFTLAETLFSGSITGGSDQTIAQLEFGTANRLVIDLRRVARAAATKAKRVALLDAIRPVLAERIRGSGEGVLWMQPPSARELRQALAGL